MATGGGGAVTGATEHPHKGKRLMHSVAIIRNFPILLHPCSLLIKVAHIIILTLSKQIRSLNNIYISL